MSKVYIKCFLNLEEVNIDLSTINPIRREYLKKQKGHNKIMSYLAWTYLKEIVYKEYHLNIDELNLTYNQYNKPLFKEFCFNISHSENVVAVAISNENIGVDIQLIKNQTNKSLAHKMKLENDPIIVIEKFSKIEAHYKKVGIGINISTLDKNVDISLQKRLILQNNPYVLSVDSDDDNIDVFLDE